MENLQIFFFLGIAIWALSLLAVFVSNLALIMRSPSRHYKMVLITLGYMLLFSFLAASLITRVMIFIFKL